MKSRVHDHASQPFAHKIDGSAARGAERFAFATTVRRLVLANPCKGLHRLIEFANDIRGRWVHRLGDRSSQQDLVRIRKMDDSVNVRGTKHILNAFQDRVGLFVRGSYTPCALHFVFSMMAYPGFTQDLESKVIKLQRIESAIAAKGVRCCTDSNHRFACVQVARDMLGFFRDRLPKPSADDHEVCTRQRAQATEPLLIVGVDVVRTVRPKGEYDGAFEVVLLTENLAQHRHRFFRPILFVASDQNNVFGIVRFVGRFKNQRVGRLQHGQPTQEEEA